MAGVAALLHAQTLAACPDAALRRIALCGREARDLAFEHMRVVRFSSAPFLRAFGPLGKRELARRSHTTTSTSYTAGALRCAPSITVHALRQTIGRVLNIDMRRYNLRLDDDDLLLKLAAWDRALSVYLEPADERLPGAREEVALLVTESILANADYDSDEADVVRAAPNYYADAQAPWAYRYQAPWRNH